MTERTEKQSDAIALAAEHASSGNLERALATLLEAWRVLRVPAIADAIDDVSTAILVHEPPIAAVGKSSERQAWADAFESKRPAAYPRLLESVPFNSQAPGRITTLAQWDPDPRITPFAREWMTTKPPLTSPNRVVFYQHLFEVLDRTEDTRLVATLLSLSSKEERHHTVRRMGAKNWKPLVALASRYAMLEGTAKANGRYALTDEDRAALDRIRSVATGHAAPAFAARTIDPQELFARVYENPADDEARAVLGDVLQEQNDPRGELIALQLARHGTKKARTPRERELETKWGRIWVGPLAPFLMKEKDGLVYERGFPSRCKLAYATQNERLIDHATREEWATFTHLDVTTCRERDALYALLTAPATQRALEQVIGLNLNDVAKYYDSGIAFRWTTLGVTGWRRAELGPLLDGSRSTFEKVRRLIIASLSESPRAGQVLRILETWPNVEDFTASVAQDEIASVVTSKTIKRLERLAIRSEGWGFEIMPKAGSKKLTVIVESFWGRTTEGLPVALRSVLETLRGAVEHVHVTVPNNRSARVEGDMIVLTQWERLAIGPLREAAASANVRITFLKDRN